MFEQPRALFEREKQKLLLHGAKGEYMACACWLHSSFIELADPVSNGVKNSSNLSSGSSSTTAAEDNTNNNSPNTSTQNVCLGLRQLDGCSKGKAIDLFEEEFNIEIEMSACVARPRHHLFTPSSDGVVENTNNNDSITSSSGITNGSMTTPQQQQQNTSSSSLLSRQEIGIL